jgi:hypothetical protein
MENIIGLVVSGLVGGITSFLVARSTLAKDLSRRDYAHLDTLYKGILELYLLHPQFQDAEKTADFKNSLKHEALLYDAFAAIVHNFLESVFDLAIKGNNIDPKWARIFDYHATLHLSWLLANDRPFEPEYCDFIRNKYRSMKPI